MSKRIAALILISALLLTLATTAFADGNPNPVSESPLSEEDSGGEDEIIQEVVTVGEEEIHKQIVWIEGDSHNGDEIIEEIITIDGEYEFEEEPPPETITIDSGLLNVTLPADISFTIDPYELNEKGQIYSDEFEISNQSEVDVLVRVDSLFLRLAENGDFVVLEQPFDDENISDYKEIYMTVEFTYNGEATQIVLSDKEPEQPLEFVLKAPASAADSEENEASESDSGDEDDTPEPDPSRIKFKFYGSVNPDPLESWSNGDISITLDYFVSEHIEDAVTLDIEEASDSEADSDEVDSSGRARETDTDTPPEVSVVPESEEPEASPDELEDNPSSVPEEEPESRPAEESIPESSVPSDGAEDST